MSVSSLYMLTMSPFLLDARTAPDTNKAAQQHIKVILRESHALEPLMSVSLIALCQYPTFEVNARIPCVRKSEKNSLWCWTPSTKLCAY